MLSEWAPHSTPGSLSSLSRPRVTNLFRCEREIHRKNLILPLDNSAKCMLPFLYSHVHVYKACNRSTAKQHKGPFFWCSALLLTRSLFSRRESSLLCTIGGQAKRNISLHSSGRLLDLESVAGQAIYPGFRAYLIGQAGSFILHFFRTS